MTSTQAPEHRWREVADRVWVLAHPWLDVNVSVVGGEDGVAVVDTLGSQASAGALLEDVDDFCRRLGGAQVRAVVNTHWHFDHTFGNAAFLERYPGAELVAHEDAAAELAREGEATRSALSVPGHPEAEGREAEVAATRLLVPAATFSAAHVVDLGGRRLELLHLGPGHTAGDAVAHVPDAGVVLAGDLVEEAGAPCYGDDSFPLEWPRTLDVLLGLLDEGSTVVPGHGEPVDRSFVEEQRAAVGVVAETLRSLAAEGVGVDDALERGEWPFAREALTAAVRRGYAQLPRSQRRLPLV